MDLNSKTLITLCSLAVLLISSVYIISTADSSSADENTPSLYDIAPSAGGSGTYDSPAETYSGTYIVDNVDKTLYVFNNSVFDLYIAGDADPWVIYMYKVANNAQSYNAGSQSANGLTVSYDSVQIHITGTPDNGSTTRIELRLEAPELGGDYDTSVITIVCVPTIVFNDLVVGEYWEYNIESEYYNNDLGDVAAGVTWGGIPDGLSINGNMISGTPTTALSGWHTSIWTEGTDPSNGGRVEGRLFANWYVTDVDLAISGEEESWLIATIGYTWSSSATKSCELSVSGMPTGSTATQQNSDIFFVIPTPGDYNLTVTATSGSASVSQTLTFHVKSQLLSASSPTDGSVSLYSEVSLTVSGTGGAVSGQGSYLIGSYADVTATPLAGWMFVGWYDGDKVMSTDADYTFLVSGDIDLSAVFAQYYEVYTSVQGEGIIDGGGKYVLDTNAALEAVPAHGYKLARWIVDGVDSSNTNPLIVDSSVTVVAVFEPREFTVTATVIGNGSVSGTGSVVHGGSIQLTAIADPGNTFWMWVLDGVESTESTLTITNIADDVVVTAKFHPDTVCVTTVIDSALGTCSPSSTVAWGGDVTLSATATTSRAFAGWYVDGVLTSTSPLTTITTITKDIVCEARFEADLCDVTITTDCVGGTILVDGVETDSVQKPRGSTISLSASSDAGYTFSGWYVGSSKVSSSPTASVTITETTVIKAVWTYSKNVSINADSLPVAPFNLHPTLSSDAGVKSVSWRLSSDDGYSRTSNGTSPSLYVRTWGDYTVTA
ncbi:MAG: hypothetical protein E7Z63_06070, partial [Thermoplasmata archaeon]|nr:hypothetical protein [Thermoplasmata archaeon]